MPKEIKKVEYKGREFAIAIKHARISDDWLVFLHGIGCAKECFGEVFRTELAKHFSLLTLDFVGFGGSDKPKDFSYTLEDHAEITKLVIGKFKPQKVTLVAHSMGGGIGALVAKDLDNLGSFINLEGNLVSQDAGIVSRKTAEQAEDGFVYEGFDKFLSSLKSSDDPASRAWAKWYENSSRIAIYRSGRSLVEWSDNGKLLVYFNDLPKKAYVYGSRTNSDHVLGHLRGTDIIKVSNAGHFMMLDNPSEFYRILSGLLLGTKR